MYIFTQRDQPNDPGNYAVVKGANDSNLHEANWPFAVLRCRVWALLRGHGWLEVKGATQ